LRNKNQMVSREYIDIKNTFFQRLQHANLPKTPLS
jgi:hypothetical protein